MLTIQPCKVFSHALGEYLRQADYYSEGMKVEGRCFGQLCGAVGLTEHAVISDEAFERVASNHHALTGEKLTERMKANRRAGYDATFNAPKSISIQAFLGGDERLIAAHETAVTEASENWKRSPAGRTAKASTNAMCRPGNWPGRSSATAKAAPSIPICTRTSSCSTSRRIAHSRAD